MLFSIEEYACLVSTVFLLAYNTQYILGIWSSKNVEFATRSPPLRHQSRLQLPAVGGGYG